MLKTIPILTAAVTIMTAHAALAQTVTQTTTVTTSPAGRVMGFSDLDINKDNILSSREIGQVLFRLYDTDGNEAIDNNEYDRRAIAGFTPIEQGTVISYDFDGDGIVDTTQYTYDTFLQNTFLTRFDANKDGISPHEFTGRDFMEADINNDKVVDLKEWQGTYIASIDAANKENSRFNQ